MEIRKITVHVFFNISFTFHDLFLYVLEET